MGMPIRSLIDLPVFATLHGAPSKVTVPYSHLKEHRQGPVDEGIFKDKKGKAATGGRREMIITLKFDRESRPIILGMKRVSKPGRRVYVGSQKAPPIRKGLGIHVLSTPKGILVDREAVRAKVGGELICTVW